MGGLAMSQAVSVAHGAFGRAALYAMDRSMVKHAHREGHLIFHVGGPDAALVVDDKRCALTRDTVCAISPWELHSFECAAEGGETMCLTLYIKPMWFLEHSQSAEYALRFGRPHFAVTPDLRPLVTRLTALLLDGDGAQDFDGLLYAMTRASYDHSWSHAAGERAAMTRFNDFRVRRALRVMRENLTEEFDMEALARSVGLSRPHFFKLFKQQMGVTPNIYMNTLRTEQAIEDLLVTEKTVTDIALDLGFSSQASFTRFFSSNVGISPSEYRRVSSAEDGGFPMDSQPTRLSGMPQ